MIDDYLLWIEYELNLRIEYHAIHKGSKGDDEACLKVDDQVSFGCEGGGEEAEEGGAAEVGDDQGDQAEKRLRHPFKFFFIINALCSYPLKLGSPNFLKVKAQFSLNFVPNFKILHTYLIFVLFCTPTHFEAFENCTPRKCVNSRQKRSRDKTA